MNPNNHDYQQYNQQLDDLKKQKQIAHTVYLSRRAIWANVILSFVLSCLASYIHTRRWKAMGIFLISFTIFGVFIFIDEDPEEAFQKGQSLSPFASLVACIDNGIAISKAKKKVNNQDNSNN